jgi:hypothetical protein
MPATNGAALVTHAEFPAAMGSAAAKHFAAILGAHALQKAVLTPAWNTLRLPGSLGH